MRGSRMEFENVAHGMTNEGKANRTFVSGHAQQIFFLGLTSFSSVCDDLDIEKFKKVQRSNLRPPLFASPLSTLPSPLSPFPPLPNTSPVHIYVHTPVQRMSLRGLRSRMATIDVSNVHSKGNRDLDPPGYDAAFGVDDASTRRASTSGSNGGGAAHRAAKTTEETPEMFQRRTAALSSLSFSPLKQVAMTSFMMYMTGTNLHLCVPKSLCCRGRRITPLTWSPTACADSRS
jgi:hypothetical protein